MILSGGAVASPQLLEVSGVGDGERLRTIGVDVVHHAPDVGEHLQDHILCKVVYATQPENSINREVQGLRLIPAALRWFFYARDRSPQVRLRLGVLPYPRWAGGTGCSDSLRLRRHVIQRRRQNPSTKTACGDRCR